MPNNALFKLGFLSRYPPMHCGVGEYTRHLLSALLSIEHGIGAYVFTSTLNGSDPWEDSILGIRAIPVFHEKDRDYSRLLDILAELNGVDILHVEHEYGIFGKSLKLVEVLEEARHEKLVRGIAITMHTVLHPSSLREDIEFQKYLNSFDAIIVHSILQEFELQWQGVDPRKIYRIPHGTLINPYLEYPRKVLANSLGIDYEMLRGAIIVIPGFIRRDKGFDILFKALGYVRDKNFTLIVAGETRDASAKKLIEEASNKHNILLIEKYLSNDELLRVIGLADILVLPYRDKTGTYSVSGILHLSMGSLKPIVGSRVPRLVELYQYAPRFTFPPGNTVQLGKMIKWVIENYDYAVPYMSSLYSYAARTQWIRMARRHLELYLRILGRG
ncbi:MAG: glycosyltransferase [Thermoprotei archaeon]